MIEFSINAHPEPVHRVTITVERENGGVRILANGLRTVWFAPGGRIGRVCDARLADLGFQLTENDEIEVF
ncbi:MAG TPA: hypothetical protein VMY42_10655 [Thermoguttaceae bacterium]|nr:hypothetical protein [Thermoguttaceae bacterium]